MMINHHFEVFHGKFHHGFHLRSSLRFRFSVTFVDSIPLLAGVAMQLSLPVSATNWKLCGGLPILDPEAQIEQSIPTEI
jgi:hypothetical protein